MRKVRIIALYIQYRDGVPDEDRRRLYQHARLTLSEQDAVNALEHLGIRITRVGLANFQLSVFVLMLLDRDHKTKTSRRRLSKSLPPEKSTNYLASSLHLNPLLRYTICLLPGTVTEQNSRIKSWTSLTPHCSPG